MGVATTHILAQFLLHRMRDGKDHDLVRACSREQRAFITGFLEHVMGTYRAALDRCTYADDMLKALEMWSVA